MFELKWIEKERKHTGKDLDLPGGVRGSRGSAATKVAAESRRNGLEKSISTLSVIHSVTRLTPWVLNCKDS